MAGNTIKSRMAGMTINRDARNIARASVDGGGGSQRTF
jgi:hypothetical protein